MSIVTGVMLITSVGESLEQFVPITRWLEERGQGILLVHDDCPSGGGKHPQFTYLTAGFNYFETYWDSFVEFVMGLPWTFPENVILILQPESGPTRVHRPGEER